MQSAAMLIVKKGGDVWLNNEVVLRLQVDDAENPLVELRRLGDIARAQGMTEVARRAGLGRESLYKALSTDGNPELATVVKDMDALGLQLHAKAG